MISEKINLLFYVFILWLVFLPNIFPISSFIVLFIVIIGAVVYALISFFNSKNSLKIPSSDLFALLTFSLIMFISLISIDEYQLNNFLAALKPTIYLFFLIIMKSLINDLDFKK